jgi:hypothetical protein
MSTEHSELALNRIVDGGVREVIFTGDGEPPRFE